MRQTIFNNFELFSTIVRYQGVSGIRLKLPRSHLGVASPRGPPGTPRSARTYPENREYYTRESPGGRCGYS